MTARAQILIGIRIVNDRPQPLRVDVAGMPEVVFGPCPAQPPAAQSSGGEEQQGAVIHWAVLGRRRMIRTAPLPAQARICQHQRQQDANCSATDYATELRASSNGRRPCRQLWAAATHPLTTHHSPLTPYGKYISSITAVSREATVTSPRQAGSRTVWPRISESSETSSDVLAPSWRPDSTCGASR